MSKLLKEILSKHENIHEYYKSIMPDWTKTNHKLWTKEEVNELIEKEVGRNIVWPTTYHVLLKTFLTDEEIKITDDISINAPVEHRNQQMYESRVGLVLAIGPDAFTDPVRFPSGPVCNIGDFVMYRRLENSPFYSNKTSVCWILDDKIMGITCDPRGIDTQNLIGR